MPKTLSVEVADGIAVVTLETRTMPPAMFDETGEVFRELAQQSDLRAVVIEGEIVVRPMMYVALTYDHRVVDGREAVTFLKRIKTCIEDPARILLEV